MAGKSKKKQKKKPAQNMAAEKKGKLKLQELESVTFDYIKSNFFRVIRVDGIHGGIGPKMNMIQMALFSERQPIPQKETYEIHGGQLGQIKEKQGRDAIVREVEIEALIDIETAKAFRLWLDERIREAEAIREKVKSI